MKINKIYYLLIFLFFTITSCKNDNNIVYENKISDTSFVKIENSYAKHFEIKHYNDYTVLKIINPWQNSENISFEYFLLEKGKIIPEHIKEKTIIRTPVKRIICMSTSHIVMIDAIGEVETIVGVSGKNYINNYHIQNNKNITDVGFEQGLNYELILNLKPDIIMLYGVEGETAGYQKKLNELGIKTFLNAEYLEDTPLAKTEWIKIIAALYKKEKEAKIIFDNIDTKYNKLKSLMDSIDYRPKILTGLPWNDTWYISSGNSNLAHLIKDAGAEFLYKSDTLSDVMALDIEAVTTQSSDADFWINIGNINSKEEILMNDSRLNLINAFKKGKLYNNNAIVNKYGGNDYFESGIINPHIVLKDLIHIFHPETLPKHKLKYYRKIK